MLKRVLPLLLILCLFTSFATADPPDPSLLAPISQFDEAFDSYHYDYWGTKFKHSGCGPSSITNALIASLGITTPGVSVSLTLDILHLLTRYSDTASLDFNQLEQLTDPEKRKPFDTANGVLSRWGGDVLFTPSILTTEEVLESASTLNPTLLICSVATETRWEFVCQTALALYRAGLPTASICIALLGAGTEDSGAPFQSGEAGHYVTLYVPVDDFCESGTLYLIDSLPRALYGEEFFPDDAKATFRIPYLFNPWSTVSHIVQDFKDRCTVERVSLPLLRITPSVPLNGTTLAQAGTGALSAYAQYLKPIHFFNGGKAFIHIPTP